MPQETDHEGTHLESLVIDDYRSCINTKLAFQPDLSVLIGPNGSGKTTILNALLLMRSLGQDRSFLANSSEDSTTQCALSASFRISDKSALLKTNIRLRTDEHNADAIVGSDQYWRSKDFTKTNRRIRIPLWLVSNDALNHDIRLRIRWSRHSLIDPVPESLKRPLETLASFIQGMKYYSASQFTNPSLCPVSFEVEQQGTSQTVIRPSGGHKRFLFDLYRAKNSSPTYEQFFNVVGPSGIGLVDQIIFREVIASSVEYTVRSGGEVRPKKREKLLVVPQFQVGRNTLSPSQLSEGTFKTLILLFYLMTEKSTILLIEEPEVCVHHGLLSTIVELVKTYSKQKQIIVSTHSDFVLDHVEPRNLYRVARDAVRGTEVTQITKSLSASGVKALKRYLVEEGNLGEYWRDGGFD